MIKFLRLFFVFELFFSVFPFLANAKVIINEVAWMGSNNGGTSSQDANDEWIELYNNSQNSVDLAGWQLNAQDGFPAISLEGIISANSFFLLERTDDSSVPTATADLIYTGAISNSGEILILRDGSGVEIDQADGSSDWQIGGNNDTKETLQWTAEGWITATSTPRLANVGQPQSGLTEQTNQPLIQESFGSIAPLENPSSIKALAGQDKTVVVGAETEFKGEALGLKNEPLKNAGYLWIFGDGAQKEGKTTWHGYYFPGVYQAVLTVSSGYYSASDYLKITVISNELYISEIKPAANGSSWIEIHNPSTSALDISNWILKSQGKKFVFPDSTYILPESFLAVSESVFAISLPPVSGEAELLYPTGSLVDLFSYGGSPEANESFNRVAGQMKAVIALESPGKENNNFRQKQEIPPLSSPALLKKDIKSNLEAKLPSETISLETESPNTVQTANVIEATENKVAENTKNSVWFWFLISLGMGIFSAAGFIFIKRY